MESSDQNAQDTPPTNIGSYQVKRLIGKGGMGEVYLCFDPKTQRDVAVKRIRPELLQIPLIRQRFLKEAKIAAQLTHPGILGVYSIEETQEDIFYVMPYIQGKTLKSILAEFRKSKGSTLHLLRDFFTVCHAVEYAHSKGVLHRDLKPENILIGRFNEVLIYDFGLAEYADTNECSLHEIQVFQSHPDLTRVGKIVGTITYMAPERILEKQDTIQSDIYSLGVILYQILTLKHPFKRQTVKEFKKQAKEEKVYDPQDVAPMREIPPLLAKIALKCLSFKKEDRYPNLKSLIKDLELYFEGKADWVFAARLDPKKDTDWELQDTIVLKQSKDWAIYMLSSSLFPGNIQLETQVTFQEKSEGIGFLLGVAHRVDQRGLDSGLTVWISPNEVRLLRAGVVLKRLECPQVVEKEPLEIVIEKLYDVLLLKINKTNIFTFPIFLPITGAHVGLVYKDMNFIMKDVSVFVGSYNARIGCLTIPDTFFASELYDKALEEYEKISRSFERRSEGLIAIFRAGLTLLELNQPDAALHHFERLHKTQKGILEWLGKGLTYRKMHDVEEEAKCYEIALNLFKNDPNLVLIEEEILFRMEQSKEEGRLGPYLFALIASRYNLLSEDHPAIDELVLNLDIPPTLENLSSTAKMAFFLMKGRVLQELGYSEQADWLEALESSSYVHPALKEWVDSSNEEHPYSIKKILKKFRSNRPLKEIQQLLFLEKKVVTRTDLFQ
jgi:serine/threonine-protein kinase